MSIKIEEGKPVKISVAGEILLHDIHQIVDFAEYKLKNKAHVEVYCEAEDEEGNPTEITPELMDKILKIYSKVKNKGEFILVLPVEQIKAQISQPKLLQSFVNFLGLVPLKDVSGGSSEE